MSNDDGEVIDGEPVPNLPARVQRVESERPYERSSNASERPSTTSPKDNLTRAEKREEETDEVGRAWRDKVLEANPGRRCAASLSDGSGERCRKWAIRGGTTCATHGSGTKAAKVAARERLDRSADRMVAHLLNLAKFAESEAVQLKATDSAIDRTLGKATQPLSIGTPGQFDEVWEDIAGGSRAESRRARGLLEPDASNAPPTQGDWPSPSPPPNPASPADAFVTPCGRVVGDSEKGIDADSEQCSQTTDYSDLQPEHVPRAQNEPLYQERSDPSFEKAEEFLADAPEPEPTRPGFDRDRHAQRPVHLTGDDALRVAADLAREQLAITSNHKRYKRPW